MRSGCRIGHGRRGQDLCTGAGVVEGTRSSGTSPNHRPRGVASLVLGLTIAYINSRPSWDDGIIAGALFAAAFVIALLAGRRPWLWGLLVGICLPVWALPTGVDPALFAGLPFAIVGSFAGYGLSRTLRTSLREDSSGSAVGTSGRQMTKLVPLPTTDATVTSPPAETAKPLTIARPSPDPRP